MNAFTAHLARGMDELRRAAEGGGGCTSMAFLRLVVTALASFHAELTRLPRGLELPPGGKWLEEYMDESSRLWDACRVLKHDLAGIERCCAACARAIAAVERRCGNQNRQYVLPELNNAVISCQREMFGLQEANKGIAQNRAITLSLYFEENDILAVTKPHGYNGFRGSLHAMRNATTLLLLILTWTMLHCSWDSSLAPNNDEDDAKEHPSEVATAIACLQRRVMGELVNMQGVTVMEFRRVGEVAMDVMGADDAEEGWRAMGRFNRCLRELREETERLMVAIDDLFEEIVVGRRRVLGLCGGSG